MEIAAECREAYGTDVRLSFLCGRDAAERIANGTTARRARSEMLAQFDLLVAARRGEYTARTGDAALTFLPALELSGDFDHVSASEVRARIARGEPWEHLVPPAVQPGARNLRA